MGAYDELETLFSGYRSPDRVADWESVKEQLPYGKGVTGRVVAKSHYGAWVDIGVGFPALLEIVVIEGLTPEKYHSGDWCPVGTEITAFIGGFDNDSRKIGLWQVRAGEGHD